jgi:hypothetical protein
MIGESKIDEKVEEEYSTSPNWELKLSVEQKTRGMD